jgi:hypothetical protein
VIDQEAVLLELFHTYWFCGSIFCCFYLFPTQLLTYRLSAVSCRLSWHRIIKFVNEYLCKESFFVVSIRFVSISSFSQIESSLLLVPVLDIVAMLIRCNQWLYRTENFIVLRLTSNS